MQRLKASRQLLRVPPLHASGEHRLDVAPAVLGEYDVAAPSALAAQPLLLQCKEQHCRAGAGGRESGRVELPRHQASRRMLTGTDRARHRVSFSLQYKR